MDIDKLISFLGHSSIHNAFDDFLVAHGVTKRPKLSDNYPYEIPIKGHGISLFFEDDPEDKQMTRKSDGQFVFYEIYIDFESRKSTFSGSLPFGLDQARNSSDILKVLGEPRVQEPNEGTAGFDLTYFIDGKLVTFLYSDDAGTRLQFIRIALKDKYHVMHGLAPAD